MLHVFSCHIRILYTCMLYFLCCSVHPSFNLLSSKYIPVKESLASLCHTVKKLFLKLNELKVLLKFGFCLAFILKVRRYSRAGPQVAGGNDSLSLVCCTHQFTFPRESLVHHTLWLITTHRQNHPKTTAANYEHHLSPDKCCDFVLDNNIWI